MNGPRLRARYGLKYNPFGPAIPPEDIWMAPGFERFAARVGHLTGEGGFAMLSGSVGAGKSKALQALSVNLARVPDLVIGVMERPQSSTSDFYRELGRLFGVDLSPANKYGGFRALRERWEGHVQAHLRHPVLLIDEAQEMNSTCLSELRLLGSVHFDSRYLLTVVLCGDERLPERFRTRELMPLGSRIRTRFLLTPFDKPQMRELLEHLLIHAGNSALMAESLKTTLIQHSAGNPRVLCNMAADLLSAAVERDQPILDEDLFLEVFGRSTRRKKR